MALNRGNTVYIYIYVFSFCNFIQTIKKIEQILFMKKLNTTFFRRSGFYKQYLWYAFILIFCAHTPANNTHTYWYSYTCWNYIYTIWLSYTVYTFSEELYLINLTSGVRPWTPLRKSGGYSTPSYIPIYIHSIDTWTQCDNKYIIIQSTLYFPCERYT